VDSCDDAALHDVLHDFAPAGWINFKYRTPKCKESQQFEIRQTSNFKLQTSNNFKLQTSVVRGKIKLHQNFDWTKLGQYFSQSPKGRPNIMDKMDVRFWNSFRLCIRLLVYSFSAEVYHIIVTTRFPN